MKTAINPNERSIQMKKRLAWILSGIVLGVSVLIAVLSAVRGHRTVIRLEDYVNVGTDAGGNPAVLLDVDAILNDLRLPNPNRPGVNAADYPEVYALCTAKMHLTPIDAEHMRVTIEADTETLERCGIVFAATTWEQQIKGFVAGATPTPVPLPQETPTAAPEPRTVEPDGYLDSLLDSEGNGLNLRTVCEAVQNERDLLCKELFGNNYDTTKTQVAFIVYTGGRYRNMYRASYSATFRSEEGTEPLTIWFTVDVFNLYRSEGAILYENIDTFLCGSEEESKQLPRGGEVTKLWGGGVRVPGKNGFDLNGFVRFPGQPTSFALPNGVYWSPTYDPLDEDMIWKLTAVDGHSLANLLRYARKEIYARYYIAFDPKTEREFNEHYQSYDWYEVREPDLSRLMTDAERSNIRLLREIQSLIEK